MCRDVTAGGRNREPVEDEGVEKRGRGLRET